MSDKTVNPRAIELMMEWEKEQKKSKTAKRKAECVDVKKDTEVVAKIFEHRRDRKFCITTYIDRDNLLRFLSSSSWIHHWALCCHDKDVDNGENKVYHIHVVFYTFEAKTASAVRKLFDRFSSSLYGENDKQNTLVMPCLDVVAQYRYLIHADDPQKFQYSHIERLTDNDVYWNKLERSAGLNSVSNNTALAIFEDILAGVSTRELTCRYGFAYIQNIGRFKIALADHLTENGGELS